MQLPASGGCSGVKAMLANPHSPVAGWDTLRLNIYSNPGSSVLGLTTRSVELYPVEVVTSFRSKTAPFVFPAVQLYWGWRIKKKKEFLIDAYK